ncbi:uncharacterized protein BT62DRAFT_1054189 [Guyanagaster necrorhizus]|uniref:RING-type E3 ubiquitin transferase n=1 Tax=Guyanagaster necrorhizus TaxID=856835 RepID=A0A9P8AVJ0_9AGAR|nr:uncharacterized protein BT62DRAFT_1054189 [Guyanagaster necrorhizus MCA 3950]KAG7449375.1 hypothetical protein BT62DRAFT_1054189 [Guyanagaster necrorhizus MCA 3950]
MDTTSQCLFKRLSRHCALHLREWRRRLTLRWHAAYRRPKQGRLDTSKSVHFNSTIYSSLSSSVNAASKGHLPVVLYLLTKQSANPLVRNNWGETAYDTAAAVFEVWICEVLQRAETERWRNTTVSYDTLAVHTTVALVLYENQRLDTRLKTLAVSGGRPKFSVSGLGKQGRKPPFELRMPKSDDNVGDVAAWRSDVQLPLRNSPWKLPLPRSDERHALEGAERSHFWLSDWTLDMTHPGVDVEDGWQYAHHFNDPEDQWSAERPPQLVRLLTGSGSVILGAAGSSSRRSSYSSSSIPHAPHTWVRRRRWVRVMRRRLDIPPLPFLQPDGKMYHLDGEGDLIPYIDDSQDNAEGDSEGQELGQMQSFLSSTQDYVGRARYLVGTQSSRDIDAASLSAIDARRAIAKLERATMELRQGILGDDDVDRKRQAEVLLNAYSRDLERRRLAAGAHGLLISDDEEHEDYDDDDSDDEFHYPGASPLETLRSSSRMSNSTGSFSQPGFRSTNRVPTDLTPQLSQAPDFRVPTHEAPQKVARWASPSRHQIHRWEKDEDVYQCRDCQRRFTFLNRRHCRRCGRIFCDRCSSYRVLLDPSDIVQEPGFPEGVATSSSQRVCCGCHDEVNGNVPSSLVGMRVNSMERVFVDQGLLTIPSPLSRGDTSSQLSDLAECPVCNRNLDAIGNASEQEAHVKNCLEGGSGTTPQTAKYLVYSLPAESTLIGVECVICLEEFAKGSVVARLSCLCSFHNTCLSSWLQRGKSCPVHAR